MKRDAVDRCNQEAARIMWKFEEWSKTPEGRAFYDAAWERQKASMRERGLTPGPD